jgi:hypothetical protein
MFVKPGLNDLSGAEHEELMKVLREANFDGIETGVIIFGLVGVTYVTQLVVPRDAFAVFGYFAWNLGVALVLMPGVIGLVHLRRVWRVTRDFLRQRRDDDCIHS